MLCDGAVQEAILPAAPRLDARQAVRRHRREGDEDDAGLFLRDTRRGEAGRRMRVDRHVRAVPGDRAVLLQERRHMRRLFPRDGEPLQGAGQGKVPRDERILRRFRRIPLPEEIRAAALPGRPRPMRKEAEGPENWKVAQPKGSGMGDEEDKPRPRARPYLLPFLQGIQLKAQEVRGGDGEAGRAEDGRVRRPHPRDGLFHADDNELEATHRRLVRLRGRREADKQRPHRGIQFAVQEAHEGVERAWEFPAVQGEADALQQEGNRLHRAAEWEDQESRRKEEGALQKEAKRGSAAS